MYIHEKIQELKANDILFELFLNFLSLTYFYVIVELEIKHYST